MLQNILHLNVSSAEVGEPSPEQRFSTWTFPGGGLSGKSLMGRQGLGLPLCRDLSTCCLFTLRTGSVRGLSPTQTALWPPVLGLTVAPGRSTNHS